MNKRLLVLICSIILFQYIYSGTACDATFEEGVTPTQALCNQRDGSGTKICVVKLEGEPAAATGCELKERGTVPCGDIEAGSSDALCMSLAISADTKVCLKASDACTEKAKSSTNCEEVKAGASDALCKVLLIDEEDAVKETYLCVKEGDACKKKKKCKDGNGNNDATCNTFAVETAGNVCKKDPNENNKCKEVKDESAKSSSNSLKFSLALLIFLFLF